MKTIRLILCSMVLFVANWADAALYIVGNGTEYLWNRQEMKQISTEVYTWEGYLTHSGEVKFMTEADGWGNHWGPTTALTPLSYGQIGISLHYSGDYKFRVVEEGYYILQVDTKNKTLTALQSDGTLPESKTWPWMLYPVGTATQSGSSLSEDGYDSGIYNGTLTLGQGSLAFHTRPYYSHGKARPVEARLSSQATANKKKLYLTLSTDRCSYAPGQPVNLSSANTVPTGAHVRYRYMGDVIADTLLTSSQWTWQPPSEDYRGYLAEVYLPEDEHDVILGTIAIDVSSDWSRFPRYGFVASYGSDKNISTVRSEMNWLNRCHINAVQFQDWHANHDWPLGGTVDKPLASYKDIANRTIYASSVKNYIQRQHALGMKSFFYNLCFGVTDGYKERGVKDEWMLYKDRQHQQHDLHDLPSSWKSDIYLANPGNPNWQRYLADRNDDVYATLDFDGYQIDQLGPRATLYDYEGKEVNLTDGYATFIQSMKQRHPTKRLIMNAVSQYGASNIGSTGKMDCFYDEVWGCHQEDALNTGDGRFSRLKDVIDANRRNNGGLQSVIAAYMNYCCDNTNFNTPGIVMTDAVIMALGGSHLELGGDHMLCREYFPYAGVKTTSELEDWMTHYYDFMTGYENLLRGDWTENTSISVSSSGATITKWAPQNKQITQVSRNVEGRRVIHLLNFHCQESTRITDPNYLTCWHDRDGLRPWPVEYRDLPLTITGLTGMGKVRRVWVASPDYMGGALQEITDYQLTASMLRLTLPALQFWTMIVIEPESTTTTDNTVYGATAPDAELALGDQSLANSSTNSFLSSLTGTYKAKLDLPAQTLKLSTDSEDGIITLPIRSDKTGLWTIQGTPANKNTRGIVVNQGKKWFK